MVPNMARGVIYHITLAEANGPTDLGVPVRVGALAPMAASHAGPWRRVLLYLAVGATLVCGSRRGSVLLAAAWLGRRHGYVLLVLLALLAIAAGFWAAQDRSDRVAGPVLEKRIGPVYLTGTIVNIETRPRGFRLSLREGEIPKRPRWRAPTLV